MGVWAVMVLAAVVRLATPAAHFQHGVFIPPDADSAYHLRRARTVFEDPVGVPSIVDPWLGFPQGATVPWSPGWDQFVAFCGWVFGGFKTEGMGVDVGMALAPLLIGVATVVLAHRLADRLFGAWAGLGAGLFCALAPQHVAATQFGRIDHNAIEGFVLVVLVAEASRDRIRAWVMGPAIAAACLGWVGGLMYAGLGMGAALLGALLMDRQRGIQAGWDAVWAMVLGVLLLVGPATWWGLEGGTPFTYAYLSAFHPAVLAVLAAGAAWLLALRFYPRHRVVVGVGGGVGLLAVSAALAPSVVTGFREWLTTEDPWLDGIAEMQPLFSSQDTLTPFVMLGWTLPLLPLALWRVRRHAPLAAATAGTALLVLLQNRFGWTLTPLMGVALAGAIVSLGRGWLAPVVLLVSHAHTPEVMEAAWVKPKTTVNRQPWSFEAYLWMRENTPPVSAEQPEYGVTGTWDNGHWLPLVAQRPEHIGHFGSYTNGVERYLETEEMFSSEQALLELMDRDRLRYVVVRSTDVHGGPMAYLLKAGASAEGHSGGLRAVFAASTRHPFLKVDAPGAWVYERVEGAVVEADEVVVALMVRGQPMIWRAQGPSVRVPYWSDEDNGVVATAPFFEKRVGPNWERFVLEEDEVR